MDIVLGVSIDPGAVRLVLVEGTGADGATVDHQTLAPTSDTVSAVLGTQALCAAGGHRLTAVAVTGTGESHALAGELAAALDALGCVDVAVVPEQQATEALARHLSATASSDAAVLSVEPDSATLSIVEVDGDGDVVKTVTRTLDGIDPGDGVVKLAAALDDPTASEVDVFVVSMGVDVDGVKDYLDRALPGPVHAPLEPEFALARGAALTRAVTVGDDASNADTETVAPTLFVPSEVRTTAAAHTAATLVESTEPRRLPTVRTLSSVLGASAVTFVVAVAIAVGMNSGDRTVVPRIDAAPGPQEAPVQAAPATEQAPMAPPPQLPPPVAAPVAPVAPAAPPVPPQVIEALNRLQQPVTIPAVPGVSDAITVPPLPSLVQQLRP